MFYMHNQTLVVVDLLSITGLWVVNNRDSMQLIGLLHPDNLLPGFPIG